MKYQSEVFPDDTEKHNLHDDWAIANTFLFLVKTPS